MVAAVARSVRSPGGFDRVERLSDGALRQGVEVDLEAEGVQPGDRLVEDLRIDERDPAVVGGPTLLVEIRLQDRGGEVLADAVLHDLHAGRRAPARRAPAAKLDEGVDLPPSPVAVPPARPDDARRPLP